jgi:hypothetical protein
MTNLVSLSLLTSKSIY